MLKKCFVGVVLLGALSAPSWAQSVYDPGNGVSLPVVVKEVHLMGATDGKVGISCVVNADGRVGTATVAESPDPKVNDVALRALRQWRFKAGLKDGKPVAVRIYVELSIEHS
jgi:TonB family protein